jgi:hypothetical protein
MAEQCPARVTSTAEQRQRHALVASFTRVKCSTASIKAACHPEVNMRALDHESFVAYAQAQIAVAGRIQADHRLGDGYCRCGRQWPCSVAQACMQTRDHYHARLALLEQTMQLPTIPTPSPEPARISGWRRVLTFVRGGGG